MADLFTMQECKGRVEGLRIAYVGDGNNNVTHSLLLGATLLGAHITVGAPPALQPQERFVDLARKNAARFGGSVTVTDDPAAAVDQADVVYTDVWVSMGRESDMARRLEVLGPYQINEQLVRRARPDFIFMHCLPAHVGEEVTADVAYGPHSVIFDEAENRLHVQKALMVYLLESTRGGVS
jgi:ornithine carbamoyltransferase